MEIRKGPYGKFATELIDDKEEIYEYAAEMIRAGNPGCFLPVYINDTLRGRELDFDISDLIPISDFLSTAPDIRRKAAADLFLSITASGNMLLDTGSIILEGSDTYWDPKNNKILIPMRPVKRPSPSVYTSGISKDDIEAFLKIPFFNDILTLEEKDKLIYGLTENNSGMIDKVCTAIRSTRIKAERKHSDKARPLIYSLISAVFSLAAVLEGEYLLSLAFFLFSSLIPSISGLSFVLHPGGKDQTEDNSIRRSIFFEDKGSVSSAECLVISYKTGTDQVKKAIYTDRATIGSDCFLSDITIDDPSIEALHLEITGTDTSYMIRDLSIHDNVMLDDHRIEKDRPYEIRDGQVILCGNIEFRISIGLR